MNAASEERPEPSAPDLSRFIENMGLHFESCGVPRIGGRILGYLLLNPRPVSSEEMAEGLQAARSSISTNLKTLQMSGMVEKVSLPGERVDFYVFSESGWQTSLEMRLAGILRLKELGEDCLSSIDNTHPARPKIEEMVAWVEEVQSLFDRLTSARRETQTVEEYQ